MKFLRLLLLSFFAPCFAACAAAVGDVQLGVKSADGPLEPVWITKTANRALGWNESGVLGPVSISGGSGSSAWADITGKPTTLAGYGIVDSITAALAASTYQPLSSNLTTYSGITPSANVQALLGAANYAAFKASLSLGNVENTALSTWAGSTNLTTLGTVSAGTWNGSIIAPAYLGTGSSISAKFLRGDGTWQTVSATGGTWGTITGTLADQTDLQTALNAKLSTATAASTYQPLSDNLNTLSAGLGFTLGAQLVTWDGTTYAKLNSALQSGFGGTGISIYATGDILYATGGSLARLVGNTSTTKKYLTQTGDGTASAAPVWEAVKTEIVIACSDETTALTTGTAKVTFRMPHAMIVSSVRLQVNTAPTGSVIIVDVKESGTTVFSTKPQIATSAFTSVGGAVPGVISDTALADDAEITINLDQIGSTIAGKGLKVTLVGTR